MTSFKLTKVPLYALLALILSLPAWAAWTEPIHLSELNNPLEQTFAGAPSISADGLSIFFTRSEPSRDPAGLYIFEATRNSLDEPFTNMRALTELGRNGIYVACPWV